MLRLHFFRLLEEDFSPYARARYFIVNDTKLLKQVFRTLSWAVYLPDYGPTEEEMPRAYIVLLLDKNGRTPTHDASIASMSISMVAHDEGLCSCILASVDERNYEMC